MASETRKPVEIMNTKKNLIVGTITGYKFHVIEPFLTSLKRTGYDGDIAFFHARIGARTRARLVHAGVILVPFEEKFPYLDQCFARHIRWPVGKRLRTLSLFSLRHLLAYCFLSEVADKYENVMLSDIRDVIFQKDPFDFSIGSKLCCFGEKEGAKLGEDAFNAQWIEGAFDKSALEKLSDRQIMCAGVTIGPLPAVIDYLDKMIDLILHAPGKLWELPFLGGIDQGVHNYLIYNLLQPKISIFENNNGPVLTLALEDSVLVNKRGQIINKNGDVPNVVHQYDRHWKIARRYFGLRLLLEDSYARAWTSVSNFLKANAPTLYSMLLRARTFSLRS